MEHNQFLKSFMNMRQNLHKKTEIIGKSAKETKPMSDPTGVSLAHIVENKPPVKEVIDYFKLRCEQLNEEAAK